MNVLVNGGAGYIGSNTVLALLERGHSVVVLDNLSTGSRELVPQGVPLFVGDVGDDVLLEKIFGEHDFEAVLHFAASIVVSESVENPLKYYFNNTINTAKFLRFITNRPTVPLFIFSSTAAVYGIPQQIPVIETAPQKPINPYGSSKLMVERILADIAHAQPFNYGVLRYFNVAGADPSMRAGQIVKEATHLIKVAVQHAIGLRDHIAIYGDDYSTSDGTCIRDYIHVADLADIHVKVLEHIKKNNVCGTWNCGYGRGYSVKEVLAAVEKQVGKLNIKAEGRRAGDPPALISDVTKLGEELQWSPKYDDIDFIVQTALEWEKRLD